MSLTSSEPTFVVGGDEAQDVLVPQHDRLVDLGLPEPGALLPGREDLDGDLLAAPLPPPHLAEAPLPDALLQDDGPGDGPLDQQRQPWGGGDSGEGRTVGPGLKM